MAVQTTKCRKILHYNLYVITFISKRLNNSKNIKNGKNYIKIWRCMNINTDNIVCWRVYKQCSIAVCSSIWVFVFIKRRNTKLFPNWTLSLDCFSGKLRFLNLQNKRPIWANHLATSSQLCSNYNKSNRSLLNVWIASM